MTARTLTRISNRARALRKTMTVPEIMLWSRLKGRGTDRPIFRRQVASEAMIFDFYCPEVKLAVEVDGATHWGDEKIEKDAARDRWLKGRGVTVLRIPASRVYRNLTEVVDGIILLVDELRRRG